MIHLPQETFEMGRDGKPLFVSGPYDTEARCRSIMARLEENCGAGHYDNMLGITPGALIARVLRIRECALPGVCGRGGIRAVQPRE